MLPEPKILICTSVCWNLNCENFKFCLQNDLEADNCKFLLGLLPSKIIVLKNSGTMIVCKVSFSLVFPGQQRVTAVINPVDSSFALT